MEVSSRLKSLILVFGFGFDTGERNAREFTRDREDIGVLAWGIGDSPSASNASEVVELGFWRRPSPSGLDIPDWAAYRQDRCDEARWSDDILHFVPQSMVQFDQNYYTIYSDAKYTILCKSSCLMSLDVAYADFNVL